MVVFVDKMKKVQFFICLFYILTYYFNTPFCLDHPMKFFPFKKIQTNNCSLYITRHKKSSVQQRTCVLESLYDACYTRPLPHIFSCLHPSLVHSRVHESACTACRRRCRSVVTGLHLSGCLAVSDEPDGRYGARLSYITGK